MLKNLPKVTQPVHQSWDWNLKVSDRKVMFLTSMLSDRMTARGKTQGFLCWGPGSKGGRDVDDTDLVVTVTQKEKEEAEGDFLTRVIMVATQGVPPS